ncbi:AAA family ATPase [Deinococcus psychrotolerans]|uniref:AAA family ATPase n=1 Tax=Deinococcus psychrotolerans TaxID=2489213 RepID=A0A3G8YPN0_9DEIO|nr:AAA family ATPase [Deinococcus psychrotolerans]AZI43591.1 AAA family ATPase [Deinococcus psychrotolerans]
MPALLPLPLHRVLVIGTTGSGKTTLARQLAAHLNVPHAEQDAWNHLPDWQEAPLAEFRAQVERFTAQEAWVMDGNYSKAQDIGWARADNVVWLDYSGWVVFWQLLRRTLRRMASDEELWNGNREDWRTLLKKDGILAWFFRTHWRNRRRMPQKIAAYPHLQVVRLSSPSECGRWLRALQVGPVG